MESDSAVFTTNMLVAEVEVMETRIKRVLIHQCTFIYKVIGITHSRIT